MANTQAVPAATRVVHVSHDQNGNTKLEIQVKYLARPSSLTPAKAAYVAWMQPNGRPAKDQGVLKVGTDRSSAFETVTQYDEFVVFVTREIRHNPSLPAAKRS